MHQCELIGAPRPECATTYCQALQLTVTHHSTLQHTATHRIMYGYVHTGAPKPEAPPDWSLITCKGLHHDLYKSSKQHYQPSLYYKLSKMHRSDTLRAQSAQSAWGGTRPSTRHDSSGTHVRSRFLWVCVDRAVVFRSLGQQCFARSRAPVAFLSLYFFFLSCAGLSLARALSLSLSPSPYLPPSPFPSLSPSPSPSSPSPWSFSVSVHQGTHHLLHQCMPSWIPKPKSESQIEIQNSQMRSAGPCQSGQE